MSLAAKDALSAKEVDEGLNGLIQNGITAQVMVTLTGGIFLVAFALELGASNFLIGILAALPALAQLVQVPAILIVEKFRNRRLITVIALAFNRMGWLIAIFIPLYCSPNIGLMVLILAICLNSAFVAIASCSWSSWVRDLVPSDRFGQFFAHRMGLCVAVDLIFTLAAGVYLDGWKSAYPDAILLGYGILFFFGLAVGIISLLFMLRVPEPKLVQIDVRFSDVLLKPFQDPNFRNLIIFLGSWNFAVNLAAPFFTVYMLKTLQLDMATTTGLLVLSQVMNFSFARIWGHVSDRFSNKSVLGLSGPLFILCIFAWTFTTLPEKHAFTMPLLVIIHVFTGISTAGVALGVWNIGLKLAPRGHATSYLAASNLMNAIAAGLAPIIGGLFADFFASCRLSWTINWKSPIGGFAWRALDFEHWDFFFCFAFLLGLYSIHRLASVQEVGEVEEKVVIHELLSEAKSAVRNFSTAAGLRFMIHFPLFTQRPAASNKTFLI